MSFTLRSSTLRFGFTVVFAIALLSLAALTVACQSETAPTDAAPTDTAPTDAGASDEAQADVAQPDQAQQDKPQTEGHDCQGPFALVEITVDPESEPLLVDPESVEVFLNPGQGQARLVCWKVIGLGEGQTLHIQGKEGEPDLFPNLQRKIIAPQDTATSGLPSNQGSWMYSLWITDKGSSEKLHFTDPEVIVRGDGDDSGDGS